MSDFKPNMTSVFFWAAVYGVSATVLYWIIVSIAQTLAWPLIMLVGVLYGAYRGYRRQKLDAGFKLRKSPMEEFKDAARDMYQATQEMREEQLLEDAEADDNYFAEDEVLNEEQLDDGTLDVPTSAAEVAPQQVPTRSEEVLRQRPADGQSAASQPGRQDGASGLPNAQTPEAPAVTPERPPQQTGQASPRDEAQGSVPPPPPAAPKGSAKQSSDLGQD